MEYPLISVLVPCYNRERYIEDALLSILEQDYPNFELIVVDDGSQDGSAQKIEALQRRFDFQFYRQANTGVSGALNTALSHARGEFIATPDSDDVMLPGRLSVQAGYLQAHPDVGCVGSKVTYIDERGREIKSEKASGVRQHTFDDLLSRAHAVGGGVAMYRHEALRRAGFYDPEIRVQDFQITLKIAHLGYRVDVLPDLGTLYRQHSSNLSKTLYRQQLIYDLMAITPYRDHPCYRKGLACVINKALKHSVVNDKAYAWSVLLQLPIWHWNRVTWRRLRHLLFKFSR
ncbi:glycosyltransferase family 2 protein [Pseudomonas sp. PDM23]|uniref:glycosyltransferase family 2 protein n=1 Tax=unclassified Pseudomonas TaxID=196821 RepID=UPI00177F549E|nr:MULTISPECIES: glycosyltransferase family A protein [unclassified Pseudomonas]MBD9576474.1 glycosyltransferase family 2 protein [Pseudomonas sp. PDM23]MBD9670401.1 glycosyltransferase family 2 protein [Pseudomonas sp. PDM21]